MVPEAAVGDRMLDIIEAVIDKHAEIKGATENDHRRHEELREARSKGLPPIREAAQRVGG